MLCRSVGGRGRDPVRSASCWSSSAGRSPHFAAPHGSGGPDSGGRLGVSGQQSGAEAVRLDEDRRRVKNWKRWGPYLAERAWATVREDYSADANAWGYFTHDQARSKAYRWGEDGIAGVCDRHQYVCFALALWNGKDPILKERLFGVTGPEGNHGEDVKEAYYYLDSTPTHSYMKCLYKYPQAEFPYARLVEENRRRDRGAPEFALADAGVFSEDRYFDVFVEYAKASLDDVLTRITACNRGPDRATLHLLPGRSTPAASRRNRSARERPIPSSSRVSSSEGATGLKLEPIREVGLEPIRAFTPPRRARRPRAGALSSPRRPSSLSSCCC